MSPEPDGSFFHLLSVLPAAAEQRPNGFLSILLLFALILVNAFFAASEIAVITLNDNKLKKMAEDGNKKAAKVLKLTENSSRFLATIQVGVTLSGFLTSASASQSFSGKLAERLSFLPVPTGVIYGVSTVLITVLLSYFSLVLGELVPKKIAMQRAEELSFKFIGILDGTSTVFKPFISFLSFSTNVVLKMLGFDPNASEETVTEEEILMMVDAGEEKGVIGETAKDMISNIFDFSDITASEIMTHRTEVDAVEDTATIQDVVSLSIADGHSRIPVYHEDLDNVLGVIYVKDLLQYVGSELDASIKITDLMRPAYFVPEGKRCSQLFTEMAERRTQIAIIVDEYGGTEGIITMEDLLESIVGDIQDEYDHEEEEIHRVDDHKFTVDGGTSIDEISDLVGVDLPEGDYDTIAGLVVEMLGRIPRPDENPSIQIENLILTVQKVEERRISKILIEVLPEQRDSDPDSED
ncbi:hemolysin family protein [Caproiciproducens faecalis]|uniref:HlyC/CorC family transporter n=1 Tax=Caproiciproducens faecalis TaxID=2820301 RepID=A0ABS7DP59_9FIRM|nr:hemolysin family protein [Caproiciproducens faecalis]MBW7573085.1 HlyC/CorC family transporter [Caproiciproducens faecalis]